MWYNSEVGWTLCARHTVPPNATTPRGSVILLNCATQPMASGVAVLKTGPGVLSLAELRLFGFPV